MISFDLSGCGVTANMPVLGTGDSGFESRHPDKFKKVKKFIKNKEDFICLNCGEEVKGGGYTNHCPKCLWSQHVDINPGDRLASCKGKMKPVSIEGGTGKGYKVLQVCLDCGHQRKNTVLDTDNIEAILAIIKADGAKRGRGNA